MNDRTEKKEIKSYYEEFITSYPIYSAIYKPKITPTITKSSENNARYGLPNQTKSKEEEVDEKRLCKNSL